MKNTPSQHSNSPKEPTSASAGAELSASIASRVQRERQKAELFIHLRFSRLSTEDLQDAKAFFDVQMGQMGPHGYSEGDIEWNCERHTVEKFEEMIRDPAKYLEIVRDDRANEIVAFFESDQVTIEGERGPSQFIQWVFVHPKYQGKGIAQKTYERFHEFCIAHGYAYADALTTKESVASRKMHENFGYKLLPEEERFQGLEYYRKEFGKEDVK